VSTPVKSSKKNLRLNEKENFHLDLNFFRIQVSKEVICGPYKSSIFENVENVSKTRLFFQEKPGILSICLVGSCADLSMF
jgi:hypothetical protein